MGTVPITEGTERPLTFPSPLRERDARHDPVTLRQLPPASQYNCRVISRRRLGAIGEDAAVRVLRRAIERLSLSARAHDRALRLARTIADLDGSAAITIAQLAKVVQYRAFDRPLRLLG